MDVYFLCGGTPTPGMTFDHIKPEDATSENCQFIFGIAICSKDTITSCRTMMFPNPIPFER